MITRLKLIVFGIAFAALFAMSAVTGFAESPRIQMPIDSGGRAFEALRPVTTTAFGYGATSVSSSGTMETDVVRIVCSTICHVDVGALVTATVSSTYLPADVPLIIRVTSGVDSIGVIQNASGGTVYITGLN